MTEENAVLTERRGRTLLITLNRPDRHRGGARVDRGA